MTRHERFDDSGPLPLICAMYFAGAFAFGVMSAFLTVISIPDIPECDAHCRLWMWAAGSVVIASVFYLTSFQDLQEALFSIITYTLCVVSGSFSPFALYALCV